MVYKNYCKIKQMFNLKYSNQCIAELDGNAWGVFNVGIPANTKKANILVYKWIIYEIYLVFCVKPKLEVKLQSWPDGYHCLCP